MDVFIDKRFDDLYARHPLVLVDAGARGGLKSGWLPARRHLRVIGFEPDRREFLRLSQSRAQNAPETTYFDVALHNRKEPIRLRVARDRGLTSLFEPNRAFLDTFPQADRFDTVDEVRLEADTLDHVLRASRIEDVDFLKADTQGSELYVLEGARETLASSAVGVEVEAEFAAIYKQQPLFADVDRLLRDLDFVLFDLRPCYWKRSAGRDLGGPRGQIVWADALYLKSVSALERTAARAGGDYGKAKLLKAISVALLYGYCDYALEICNSAAGFDEQERGVIRRRIYDGGRRTRPLAGLPGSRLVAAGLRRLSRLCLPHDHAWSISRGRLGNDK